ncbi:MAG: class II fumarate hydratase, partial [Anaerolineales bacterium]|nr:class II fumarate hydratase [Anaerolineales bacterium]
MKTRLEHDLLGEREVPIDTYYGIHTLRALENFPISNIPISTYPNFVKALAAVKQACALANHELGLLEDKKSNAIVSACKEIMSGELCEQFVVDVIQGGAGTSTNMNVNEVIANRGLEILGFERGDYKKLHPLEDVNMSQSTNDVYPTAMKVALRFYIDELIEAMEVLRIAFAEKAIEFKDILKMGRTQLQDAVPMTLGQEFSTYAVMLEEDQQRLREGALLIQEINLGATAIGTGINAHPEYASLARKYLSEVTGIEYITAGNLVEATQDVG